MVYVRHITLPVDWGILPKKLNGDFSSSNRVVRTSTSDFIG